VIDKPISASIKPPKRVQIVKAGDSLYWKPGQFGYALSYSTHPGMYTERGPSAEGELAFLVSKTSNMRGGATWFSADALRFTAGTGSRRARDLVASLSDAEKIAVDLLLQRGNGHDDRHLSELIPDADRRAYIRSLATEIRSHRTR
jgi:hypothetical protein